MTQTPIGDLCVLKESSKAWVVAICWGGVREHLGSFAEYSQASEFALAERDRRRTDGDELTIHFPDDCPCFCFESS